MEISMNNKLTLYLPEGRTLDLADLADLYEHKMARRFGGATVVQASGSWINGAGELEQEPVTMITSYFSGMDIVGADVIKAQFVHDLKKAGEEAVMYVLNGTATIS